MSFFINTPKIKFTFLIDFRTHVQISTYVKLLSLTLYFLSNEFPKGGYRRKKKRMYPNSLDIKGDICL